MQFEELKKEHWDRFQEFRSQMLKEGEMFTPHSFQDGITFEELEQDPGYRYVVLNDGEIVGFCRIGLPEAVIGYGILKKVQGRHLGTQIIEFLEATARQKGINRLLANVYPNNWRSVCLLHKFGYRVVREYHSEDKDYLLMEKNF